MLRYCLFFLLCTSLAFSNQNEVIPHKVVVKLKAEFATEILKIHNGTVTQFEELIPIIGTHSLRSFLMPVLIKNLYSKQQSLSKSTSRSLLLHGSDRIIVIAFEKDIDVKLIASKLQSFPFVEYSEPLYQRNTTGVPNDPQAIFQYHLEKVKAFEAWDSFTSTDSVVIGIVDTGIDYDHEDLVQNMWFNRGEIGTDQAGNDKRTNGIDDDNNGFTDDVRGWDFVSDSFPVLGDNNPYPGNEHGTHVAGISGATVNNAKGIAGVGHQVKLMAVKIGYDNPFSSAVTRGFDGIAYAAIAGAEVINCSWGGSSYSKAEQDIVNELVSIYNVIIVAAAGNSGEQSGFYPASYQNVLSVASTRQDDKKSDFSNYYKTVGISAPGSDIYSTVPNNSYRTLSGTSMASPVVAGAIALTKLKYPNDSPEQLRERLKATSDDISGSNNDALKNLMGSGRVNIFNAITRENVKSVIPINVVFFKSNQETFFYNLDTIQISIDLKNVLDPLSNGNVKLTSNSLFFKPTFLVDNVTLGSMAKSEVKGKILFSFVVPPETENDKEVSLLCTITDENSTINEFVITLFVNPTYRTIRNNNITVTVNSIGNLGFNDYSTNLQGEGFLFKNTENILFESALMVATSSFQLSNVARGFLQESADRQFEIDKVVSINKSNNSTQQNLTIAHTEYSDRNNLSKVGVEVTQQVYQSSESKDSNFIISVYTFKNNSTTEIENFHAGLFFDWDIGPGGIPNIASFNPTKGTGIMKNSKIDTFPKVGVRLLSPQKINFFAIDNNGSTNQNPGIYDGFSTSEKWRMLSSGIERLESNPTDASFVIGGGPMTIPANGTVEVAFSIGAGFNTADVEISLDNAKEFAKSIGVQTGEYNPPSSTTVVRIVYPNPTFRVVGSILEYELDRYSFVKIDVIDNLGRVLTIVEDTEKPAGQYSTVVNTSMLSTGVYYLRFHSTSRSAVQLLQIN